MQVIAIKALKDFWKKHPEAEQPLKAWYAEARKADWEKQADITRHYRSASILEKNRVVFNIKGNEYRLVVEINYYYKIIYSPYAI